MAYRIHRGATAKKISAAWEIVAAATGSGETAQREEKPAQDNLIINTYFGDELLFVCYEFYDRFKRKPEIWEEVFEFLGFMKVKNTYREMAINAAKGGQNG